MSAKARCEALAAIERGIDWNRMVELAEFHRCLPLLHKQVVAGDIPGDALPRAVRDRLDARAIAIARRSLRMTAELTAIVRDFEAHGIDVLPLKGPVIAQTIYGSLALRNVRDLDILCRRDQVDEALERLANMGYESPHARFIRPIGKLGTSQHISLFSRTTRMTVELHFRLYSPFFGAPVELPAIAHRLHRVRVAEIELSAFYPEDLLVHLCIHGSGHAWERLEWLCGVAELVGSGRANDWARVAEWSKELRATRLVALGMALATTLLDAPVIAAAPRLDRRASSLARDIQSRFARNPFAVESPRELARVALQTDASIMHQFRRVWGACFVPKMNDFRVVKLPDRLRAMYYVIRPIRLATRFLGTLLPRAFAGRPPVNGLKPPTSA